MCSLDDVWHVLDTRRIPDRLHARCRAWIVANQPPYRRHADERQCAEWVRFLERFPEWSEAEFLGPDFVLNELRMQANLPGDAR